MTIVREARTDERAAIRNVVDGAALELDRTTLAAALDAGDALVAVPADDSRGTVLGALVLDGRRIAAVAVRRGRRDQGIGTTLVEAASRRRNRLVAEFDPAVGPFWDSLGFEIECVDGERCRAVR